MRRSETQLVEQAMRQRWPMPDEYREATLKQLIRIVADPTSKKREVIGAAKALMAAEAQNQKDEHLLSGLDELRNRIIDVAIRAGIDGSVLGIETTTDD